MAYVVTVIGAIREQHQFLRRFGPAEQQKGAADLYSRGYAGLVECERERQGEKKDRETEVPAGGPQGSVEKGKVAVAVGDKKRKKKKKEDEPHEDETVADAGSHIPASLEILSEQRRKKEKHSTKELVSVVKQEPDLIVEEELGSERKTKKNEKHSDKKSASIVKQEPGLVVEEEMGSQKKGQKQREKVHVKLEEDVVEIKGQIVDNVVAEQGGTADGEKKRKKKKHSEENGYLKGVKLEGKMGTDSYLNRQEKKKKKKKKKRGRGDGDDKRGEHKKKQRNES